MPFSPSTGQKFERAVEVMSRLRAPGGCPWDREQTFDTIKPYTLEETYEVLEAIDSRDWEELKGELGDLLLQVLFYAEMAQEDGHFTIDDVLDRLAEKLIARHPHVFGDAVAKTSADVLRNWQALKAAEKKQRSGDQAPQKESVLAGVSSKIPALLEAYKLSSRAAHVGFEWPEFSGLVEKLEEEVEELQEQLARYPAPGPRPPNRGLAGAAATTEVAQELRDRMEDEVGDLLFTAVNIARYLQLDPESALRKTNRKFKRRFQHVEAALEVRGQGFEEVSLEELESLWQESKQADPPSNRQP